MKLVDENEEKEYDDGNGDIIAGLFILLLIAIITITGITYAYKEISFIGKETDSIVSTAVIKDIYKSNTDNTDRYYILVSTKEYGSFEIEINASEFMTYKVEDKVSITIKEKVATVNELINNP